MTETATSVADEADAIVERLSAGETAWARTSRAERSRMLAELGRLVDEHAEDWVRIACEIKQLPASSPLVGEEWVSGPWAVQGYVQAMLATLENLDAGGDPLQGCRTRRTTSGQLAVRVLPHTGYDRLLLNGFSADVWMQPGVEEPELRATVGLGQREPHSTEGATLVLGAGNITSIAPLDVLYVLMADNRTAVLKLNPITDRLAPVFRAIFAPFIRIGAVEVITGDIEIGTRLAHHPGIAAVHMTGSEATHDAIVWGTGDEALANKAAGTPLLDKPMSSELGGVAPVIVVPGRWSRADLRYQARHVATMRLHNAGSNCIGGQVVVLSADWKQKDAFLAELRTALAEAPARPSWYPGCHVRTRRARDLHATAEAVGTVAERTLITGLDLADPTETAFAEEYFGPVLGVAELPGSGVEFLQAAVRAANTRLRGTLGANIVIHPRSRRQLGRVFEHLVGTLRYGSIGINAWSGVAFLLPHATWGAFPGHPLEDVQSGRGVVHNALLLSGAERTVVTGPFRPSPRSLLHGELSISPKPPWFVDNRTAATTGRRLTRFAARPRVRALPGIFASALRG